MQVDANPQSTDRGFMDFVSKEKRSKIMRGVKGKNTLPELRVRSLLHRMGFRFRIHRRDLPGKPDICLRKYCSVIQVNGCFWHHHEGCVHARIPSSNEAFWASKISKTQARDILNTSLLNERGWRVITVWECELADEERLTKKLIQELKGGHPHTYCT